MVGILRLIVRGVVLAVAAATVAAGAALFRPDLFPMVAAMRLPPDGVLPVALFLACVAFVQAFVVLRPVASSGFRWKRLPYEFVKATFVIIPVPILEVMLAWRAFGTPAEATVGVIAIPCAVTWLVILVRWARREMDDEGILRGSPELPDNPLLANLMTTGLMVVGLVWMFSYTLVVAGADYYLESILFDHVMPTFAQFPANVLPGPHGWNAVLPIFEICGGWLLVILVMAFMSAWQARPRGSDAKRFDR